MSGLWRKNPTTSKQRKLISKGRKPCGRVTQADFIASMLRNARAKDKALDLPEILQAEIAQFTARIFELRERGFVIENELRRSHDGRVLSRYWLRHDPEQGGER